MRGVDDNQMMQPYLATKRSIHWFKKKCPYVYSNWSFTTPTSSIITPQKDLELQSCVSEKRKLMILSRFCNSQIRVLRL